MEDMLYVIDLDRTLLDVDRAMEIAEEACGNIGVDFSEIKKERQESFDKSKTYRPYSPLAGIEKLGGGSLTEFKSEFLKLAESENLVFADAGRYLERLKEAGSQYLILTYASDERWQELKMQAAKLDLIPHIIVFHPRKGMDIAGWQGNDGKFDAPLEEVPPADNITFIDDRPTVFDGLPGICQGYHIDRSGDKDVVLPQNVKRITSFDQIIDKI